MLRNDRVRALRKAKGYTRERLAEEVGVGTKMIWRYENEPVNIGAAALIPLAKVLGCTTDYLLGLSDATHNGLSEIEHDLLTAFRRGDIMGVMRLLVEHWG